jgi:hypothetical protein
MKNINKLPVSNEDKRRQVRDFFTNARLNAKSEAIKRLIENTIAEESFSKAVTAPTSAFDILYRVYESIKKRNDESLKSIPSIRAKRNELAAQTIPLEEKKRLFTEWFDHNVHYLVKFNRDTWVHCAFLER